MVEKDSGADAFLALMFIIGVIFLIIGGIIFAFVNPILNKRADEDIRVACLARYIKPSYCACYEDRTLNFCKGWKFNRDQVTLCRTCMDDSWKKAFADIETPKEAKKLDKELIKQMEQDIKDTTGFGVGARITQLKTSQWFVKTGGWIVGIVVAILFAYLLAMSKS
jgi:hypothetical protein